MARVTDQQVRELHKEIAKQGSVEIAALRVGMHRNTARKYLKLGRFPSDMRKPRTWETRPDPFVADWPEIEARLVLAPGLQARALFENLMLNRPGVYDEGQLRTFQRRVKVWRAHHGPDQEVFFRQDHRPGEAMQTDFTWATELDVTILGLPFSNMLCHVVLPYSNWDWVTVCQSESMLALRRGVPAALIQLGRVPLYHQTDNSTAATHVRAAEDEPEEDANGKPATQRTREFNADYLEMNAHYTMKPRTIGIGKSEQNGDVEASNGALKSRLNQFLLLRANRDFPSVEAWETWVQDICRDHNKRRRPRVAEELAAMRPLQVEAFLEFDEIPTRVTSESTLVVKRNTYSVHPRLIGERVQVRLYEMRLEVWHSGTLVLELPRLIGRGNHHIDYRHVIDALLRKAGAFRCFAYKQDLILSPVWQEALTRLQEAVGERKGEVDYLRLLHLAAKNMECEVEAALSLLMDGGQCPSPEAVKKLLKLEEPPAVPAMEPLEVKLDEFDSLTPAMLAEAV
jgi:hypothetical protein